MPATHLSLITATERIDSPFIAPPLYPILDWMTDEAADAAPSKMTLYPNGRVAGVVAPSGRCLLDGSDDCWMVPRPVDGRGSSLFRDGGDDEDYAMAHVGTTWCELYPGADEYVEIPTACLAGPGGHADGHASVNSTRVHYDDTDFQVARGRYVWSDIAGGVVFVGAMWPDLTDRQVATARAAACSVDYRLIRDENRYRLIATCLVSVGGLPSRYARIAAAITAGATVLITDEMVERLLKEAEGYTEQAAVCASLGVTSPTLSLTPASEDLQMSGTGTPLVPPTIERTQPAPPVDAQHAHTAAPGQPCSCGQTTPPVAAAPEAPAVEADHPAVLAATGDVSPAAVEAARDASPEDVESRRAAYVLVEDTEPDWGDEITWAGGVGLLAGWAEAIDGSRIFLVYPQIDGEISYDRPMKAIPESAATITGREYEYIDPWDYSLDTVVLEPAGDGAAASVEESALASASTREIPQSAGARLAAGRKLVSFTARTPIEGKVAAMEKRQEGRLAALEAENAALRNAVVARELRDL